MDRPGFATGLLTGLGLGLGLSFLIALAFPPFVLEPPAVDEVALTPPAPSNPATASMSEPELPAPLLSDPTSGFPSDALSGLAPQAAPDVFEGNPTGSPSLVPTD